MRAINLSAILFFICVFSLDAFAQNLIVLQKGNNLKTRIRYKVGQPMTYKQKEIPYFISDVIREIHPNHIVLGDNILSPNQIEVIDISRKDERNSTLRNLTVLPGAAALLLLTAETVNSLYGDGKISYDNTSLSIAGGLLGASLIMSQVRYKKFRINGKRKILIITQEEWDESINSR